MPADFYSKVNAWATVIIAGAAIVTIIVAVCAIYIQNKKTQFIQSVELTIKFNERFGTQLRSTRIKAAKALLEKDGNSQSVEDILIFFDEIGLLVRRGALDEELVCSEFSDYVDMYWLAGYDDYIKPAQDEDSLYYTDLQYLHDRMKQVLQKQGGNINLVIDNFKSYLEHEASLDSEGTKKLIIAH